MAAVQEKNYLTIQDVARLLRTSVRTVYRFVAEGKLPRPYRLSARCLRWEQGEIQCQLEQLRK